MLIKLSKPQEKALRYVDRARSKDKAYPSFSAVRMNGKAEAADGHRYHAVNVAFETKGLWHYDKPAAVLELEPEDGALPDLSRICPRGVPQSEITLDAKMLRDALQGLKGMVTLTVYGKTLGMTVQGRVSVPRV
ncbi:hypothetical protein KAT92_06630, partial [Candidatus Babeliales bacterium]|nr:hypothetical protein [Candidatus Babeliales bacterium]